MFLSHLFAIFILYSIYNISLISCQVIGANTYEKNQVTLGLISPNPSDFNDGFLWASRPDLPPCQVVKQNDGQSLRHFYNWIHTQPGSQFPIPNEFVGIAGGVLLPNRLVPAKGQLPVAELRGGWFILGGFVGTGFQGRLMNSNQIYVSTDLFANWNTDHDGLNGIQSAPPQLTGGVGRQLLSMRPQGPINGFVAVVYNENFIFCGGHTGTNILSPITNQGVISGSCFSSQTARGGDWAQIVTNQQLFARYDAAATVVVTDFANPDNPANFPPFSTTLQGHMVITGGSTLYQFVTNDVIQMTFGPPPATADVGPELAAIGLSPNQQTLRFPITVTQLGNGPWKPRAGHQMVNYRNHTIMSGGFTTSFEPIPAKNFQSYNPSYFTNMFQASHYNPVALNDVWWSNNAGLTWQQASANAPWPARFYHNMVATTAAIYVLAGTSTNGYNGGIRAYNDLWQSYDFGTSWFPVPLSLPGYPKKYLAMAANVGSIKSGGSVIAIVGGFEPALQGSLSREVYFLGQGPYRLDNAVTVSFFPPGAQVAAPIPQPNLLLPVYAVALVVIGGVVFCMIVSGIAACRGPGTPKEKAIKFRDRFKTYKPKKWGKATVSAPVNVTSSVDGNANYTPSGGVTLDRPMNPDLVLSSSQTVGRLRSDDPETEMVDNPARSTLDEGNQAMVGNFHYTGKVDSSSTYGSPRSQSTVQTYGQTAGVAHPAYQFQTPIQSTTAAAGLGLGMTNNGYNTGLAYGSQTGYGQTNTGASYSQPGYQPRQSGYGQQPGYGQTNNYY